MSSEASSSTVPSKRADSRSTDGCRTCRKRRVKCDTRQPTCGVCTKAGLRCKWNRDGERSVSPLNLERSRIRLACSTCRARKVRCPGPSETGPCARCVASKVAEHCQWGDSKGFSSPNSPDNRAAPASTHMVPPSPFLSKEDFAKMARLYFMSVHHFDFLTFLHQPTFFRLLEADRIPEELKLTMSACTMRFVMATSLADLERADAWMDEALRLLVPKFYQDPGAIHLMSALLAQTYEQHRGRYTSWWMLTSNVTRLALYLSLHVFDETFVHDSTARLSPLLPRETLRRLSWSVFFMDSIADGGRSDMSTVTEATIRNQLPCTEDSFIIGQGGATGRLYPSVLDDPATLGISAHLLRTAAARRRILHFAWSVRDTHRSFDELRADLIGLTGDLEEIVNSLPPRLAYSSAQMFRHESRLPAFVLLHTLRHNCYIILERAKILVYSRVPGWDPLIAQCRRDRIARALPTSVIIGEALKHDRAHDAHVVVQAYVALEILILEPRRLNQQGYLESPEDPVYAQAMLPLFEILRSYAFRSVPISRLHKEAAYRLARVGLVNVLKPEDWATVQRDVDALPGDTDAEYDFRNFRRDINLERSRKTGVPASNIGADTLLNRGAMTAAPSLVNSPTLRQLDEPIPAVTDSAFLVDGNNLDLPFADFDANFVNNLLGIADQGGFAGPNEAQDAQRDDPLAWLWATSGDFDP